jgi:TRAP-type C4-dicarboxylate transport system substrate-binding protein
MHADQPPGAPLAIPLRALPRPALPRLALPRLALPRLALPRLALPRLALPRLALPRLALPRLALPRLGLSRLAFPGRGLSRRTALAALATPFLPRFARAADVVWRVGHSAPVDFALHQRLLEAAATVATRSEGKMAIEVHPNSELGSPVGLIAQARAGTIDAVPLSNQILSTNLALTALPMIGFAFAGYDQVWPAMDGDTGKFLRAQIQQRLGLVAMERIWDFGFRQITTTTKPITTASDLQGLRLRTPPEADFIGLFQALKALPLGMPLSALDQALTSHAIDGQESVLPLVKAASLQKTQSRCAMTNHVWDGQWICISESSWQRLPAGLKEIVATAFDESGLNHRKDTIFVETAIRTELEAFGMKFSSVDPKSFRDALRKAGYYSAWKTKVGDEAWASLEKYTGRLT